MQRPIITFFSVLKILLFATGRVEQRLVVVVVIEWVAEVVVAELVTEVVEGDVVGAFEVEFVAEVGTVVGSGAAVVVVGLIVVVIESGAGLEVALILIPKSVYRGIRNLYKK